MTRPFTSTSFRSASAWIRSAGLPATTSRSAASPGAIRPVSSPSPRASAAATVAARMASSGDIPYLTISSSSVAVARRGIQRRARVAARRDATPRACASWKLATCAGTTASDLRTM